MSGPVRFTIGEAEFKKRTHNIILGAGFSVGLGLCTFLANRWDPARYSDVLLGSIVAFLVGANLINYWRHLRYVKLAKNHRLEIGKESIAFWKGKERSVLALGDIAGVFVSSNKKSGVPEKMRIALRNNRNIRLEGYQDMAGLHAALRGLLPREKFQEGK